MSVDVTSLVMDRYHINENRKKIEVLEAEIEEMENRLKQKCIHSTIITTKQYRDGGYDDYVSSVRITKTCSLCDKVLESYDDPKHSGHFA